MEDGSSPTNSSLHERKSEYNDSIPFYCVDEVLQMKSLFPLLEDNGIKLAKYLETRPEATNGDGYEAKELSARFTINNIASSVFGLEGKCFEEENSHFRKLATEFFSSESGVVFKFFIMIMFPPLGRLLRLRQVPKYIRVFLYFSFCF
jgi:hypothetical protein